MRSIGKIKITGKGIQLIGAYKHQRFRISKIRRYASTDDDVNKD